MSRVIESTTVEAVLSIEVVCDQCQRKHQHGKAFLEMAPKVGTTVPFYLCLRCWLDYDGFDGPENNSRVLEPVPHKPKERRDAKRGKPRSGTRDTESTG